VPAGS